MNHQATIFSREGTCPMCGITARPIWQDGDHTGCASCLTRYVPIHGMIAFGMKKTPGGSDTAGGQQQRGEST